MITTEEEARAKVRAVWQADVLYIVLSESQYKNGRSVPRVFQVASEHLSLSIFTQYADAAAFCAQEHYLVDGRYLIGRIDNLDPLHDLFSIVNLAAFLGIHATDIDCGTEDAIHVGLGTVLAWGGRKPEDLSALLSQEAMKRARQTGIFPLRFNEMDLYSE